MNIIITGASRGIGFEVVKLFSENAQNNIVAVSRSHEGLAKLKQECMQINGSDNVHVLPFDLLDGNYRTTLLPGILKHMEKIDILVNNAGALINKPFELMEENDFNRLFNTNVKGIFLLTKNLLPYFVENTHIVNISSMGGYQGSVKFPGLSLYSASKGAVAVLTECLAEELKPRQIKVNCLALGSAQTEMLEEAFPGYKAPLSASEMAAFISHFALTGHFYFNGKILPVSSTTP